VKVTMLLADYAQVADGKLNIIGGGWTVTGPHPIPSAVAIKIGVPWDQANRPHRLTLRLLDEDGNAVMVQPEEDAPPQPLQIDGRFVADRQNVAPGTPVDATAVFNFGPLPLRPASRYVWELAVDGHTAEDWRLPFSTRPAGPEQLAS
jgi:hypothetical protein